MESNKWTKPEKCCGDGACVEVMKTEEEMLVRNSESGPALRFSFEEWGTFLDGAARGEFGIDG